MIPVKERIAIRLAEEKVEQNWTLIVECAAGCLCQEKENIIDHCNTTEVHTRCARCSRLMHKLCLAYVMYWCLKCGVPEEALVEDLLSKSSNGESLQDKDKDNKWSIKRRRRFEQQTR